MHPSMTYQPTTLGRRITALDFGRFHLTEAEYTPGLVLEQHAHRHPAFTVVLHGGYHLHIGGRDFECTSRGFYFELGDSPHVNRVGPKGLRSLIIEVRDGAGGPRVPLPTNHCMTGDPQVLSLAREAAREFRARDDAAILALEGILLEMMAALLRRSRREGRAGRPAWLRRVLEGIHDDEGRRLAFRDLAEMAGVHPTHLARVFRRHEGCSVGEYLRRLQLKRAERMIRETRIGLAEIALSAGFYDQPHLTRAFKKHFGVTPGALRQGDSGPT